MNLAIDIGNTFIKAGVFEDTSLMHTYHHLRKEDVNGLAMQFSPRYVIVSSVASDPTGIMALFPSAEKCLVMSPALKLPVKNLYKTPQTLGMDRIAGATGALQVFPRSNTLVIDAGTCITYDFVDREEQYHGGSISPGITMRFKALHTFTEKLPLIDRQEHASLIGGNTEESILSGVLNGVLAETEGIIGRYRKDFPDLRVILCGGDALFFESQIKETIFVTSDLVLMGLNSILLHNVSEG